MMSEEETAVKAPQDINQVRDDLAFLSDIMSERQPALYGVGLLYGWAGLLYGMQCLITWISEATPVKIPPTLMVVNGVLPTVIFIGICIWAGYTSKIKGFGQSHMTRALSGVFQGAGIANFSLLAVFALAAFRREDFSIWLFYPVSVCALQGAVWYGAAVIRRRFWMGAIAIGWMLSAVLASLFTERGDLYLLVMTIAFFALMAIPGYVFIRISRTGEASA